MTGATAARVLQFWPERRAIKMWDGEVSYLAWENAPPKAPSLHFAHANGFNALTYRFLLDGLSAAFRIYASDLRGHGQTTLAANPKGMRTWMIYRDDILKVLQDLDGRPKVLVGHSMGATASLMAAAAKPNWVTGLILVEPVIMPPRYLRWKAMMSALGLIERVSPMIAQAKRRRSIFASRDDMFEAYRGRGAFRTWPEEVVRDYIEGGSVEYLDDKQVRLACTPGWEAANYRAATPNIWPELEKVRCPVTLIVGEKRSTCPEPVVAMLHERMPGLRIVRVPEASHFLPMEFPAIVQREIRAMAGISDR
ncbi:MAG: alpha/beta hydrolase [Alphaproteobacteria bacterium]|nr:alpha/beta hydrolase [Alphaproteobacteria bacterium]